MIGALGRPRDSIPPDALTPYTMDAAVDNYLRLIDSTHSSSVVVGAPDHRKG
jgi:hypothetical protein